MIPSLPITMSVKKLTFFLLMTLSTRCIIAMETEIAKHKVTIINRLQKKSITVSQSTKVYMDGYSTIYVLRRTLAPSDRFTFSVKPNNKISHLDILLPDTYKQSSIIISIDKPQEVISIIPYSPKENTIAIRNTTHELARIHTKLRHINN